MQEQLLELLHHIPDAILCIDRSWRLTYANEEATRLSQLPDLRSSPVQFWDLFPDLRNSDFEHRLRTTMSQRTADHFDFYYEPFNVWVDLHSFPTAEGLALYYREVSASKHAEASRKQAEAGRKQAEAAREKAVRKLQQVFDSAPDLIVCVGPDWNCTFANQAARITLQRDHLIGANLWTDFPLNQSEPFASNYRTTMERRTPTEFEAFYPAPLNVWFKVVARPYEDGIIIFSADITSRKKAEARRDATSRQLQQVFDAITDSVISISRDWTMTFVSPRAQELLAVKGDLVGKNIWEEFPDANNFPELKFHYRRAMHEGIPGQFEIFYPAPLNLWLSIACRPSDDGIVLFFRDITPERAFHEVLLERQATLAFVQETACAATWKIDLATRAMTFGPGSWPVHGHPLDTIRSMDDLLAITVPAYVAEVERITAEAAASAPGVISTIDYQVVAADGRILWVECRARPIQDETGVTTELHGMSTDITARKGKQDALAASEERYRVLADLNPQAIWMGAPDGAITYANQGFLDYIGLTMAAASDGLAWLSVFFAEDRQRVLETWTRSVTTGCEYELEARMVRAQDGAIRWWWLRALPVRDDEGKILNWLGVAIDIHDRKQQADQLQAKQLETERQHAELEAIYKTAPIGLALFDPVEFRYLRLNFREAEFYGLLPEEIIGKTVTELAPIAGVREMFEQVAAGTPIVDRFVEGELATRPDEHRSWTVNYYPVYNSDGSVQAISTASLEITNQKKAEAALIQSEKLAAVGRLASSISHEINNPLEAITNVLYLIGHDPSLPESLQVLIGMAQSELARVCQIATQTLRFHRQSVGATRVTARELVNAVLNLYQGRLLNSDITVEATYASSTPILCFENDIRQVLNNLIANSIDAMRQHGGRLVVRAHDTTTVDALNPHGYPSVRITIADTGHGMSPDVQARIFEPFYTTKDLNGTGLGLWISKGIVTRHKGLLLLRSSTHETHHGTVFSLLLPIDDHPSPNPPPA